MAAIGGRHLQASTGRWIRYFAPVEPLEGDRVLYVAVLSDAIGFVALTDGVVGFDPARVSSDEAARAAIGRWIDTADLPPGQPPDPAFMAGMSRIRCW